MRDSYDAMSYRSFLILYTGIYLTTVHNLKLILTYPGCHALTCVVSVDIC